MVDADFDGPDKSLMEEAGGRTPFGPPLTVLKQSRFQGPSETAKTLERVFSPRSALDLTA